MVDFKCLMVGRKNNRTKKNKLCKKKIHGRFFVGFNDKNLVVCVRQLKPLTKFEKMWNSPCIAIEDPFDLDHNLGAGLSRKSE